MLPIVYVVYIILKCCSGQFVLSDLFPPIMNQSHQYLNQDLAHDVVKTPYVETSSKIQANPFTATEEAVAKASNKLANTLGSIQLPVHNNPLDNAEVAEEFFKEYDIGRNNEDIKLGFGQLASKYGRDTEFHEVVTKDGYVLSLCRILGSREPVFLMHGLLGSADDFIVAGPESGLAYLLNQQDYDVWLGNARGNKFSQTHVSISPSESGYWDFSWHEIGIYDLPSMIDYVLHTTNRTSLKYIGHSQGTTAFFVMTSEKPEYNRKVSLMIALSPVAFMSKVRSPIIRLMAPGTALLQVLSRSSGKHEFLPDIKLRRLLQKLVCGAGAMADVICSNMIFLTFGFDFSQLNISNLPVIFSHLPSGASMKQFVHYGQGIINEDFRKFDYGSMENSEKYGTMLAPTYNLSNIETPIWMFCSQSDWLAAPQDVELLRKRLSNVIKVYQVPHKDFNHVDFIIAKDVVKFVYRMVLKVMLSF